MQFTKLTQENILELKPFFDYELQRVPCDSLSCEFSLVTLLCWSKAADTHFAIHNGCLYLRHNYGELGIIYRPALGAGTPQAIPGKVIAQSKFYAGENWQPTHYGAEYVYEADKLKTLSGKKLHSKKNHFNAFLRANEAFEYLPMNHVLAKECIKSHKSWGLGENKLLQLGNEALHNLLANWESYCKLFAQLKGGVLRINDNVIAFTVSEEIRPDTAIIHFEHADKNIRGSYTAINKIHLCNAHANVIYVNREDDAGQEGLKKAKQSYNPVFMIEKYRPRNPYSCH